MCVSRQLAERIPLKRLSSTPCKSRSVGKLPGSCHVCLEFDVADVEVPASLPPEADAMETHMYHLKHIFRAVPRAEDLSGRHTAHNLRIYG